MNLLLAFFQDQPPIISQPAGTDWVQLATTIGTFLVTIIGMILTYLKANKAAKTADSTQVHLDALAKANTVIIEKLYHPTQEKPTNSSSIPSNP